MIDESSRTFSFTFRSIALLIDSQPDGARRLARRVVLPEYAKVA